MNERIIKELKKAYDVKPSVNKNKFIESIKQNDMSTFEFILLQTKHLHSYFSIRCFLFSLVLICVCLFSENKDTLMFASALIPFIVLVMMYELNSSRIFKMEEIEQVTRFSLKMIVFARLFIVGIISMLCLIVLAFLTLSIKQIPIIQIVISFFLPYFITIYSCLIVLRKYHDNEIKYSFIVTTIISLIFIYLRTSQNLSHTFFETSFGLILLIIFIGLSIVESKRFVMNNKEVIWN